jgi:molecular chaperone GrpE
MRKKNKETVTITTPSSETTPDQRADETPTPEPAPPHEVDIEALRKELADARDQVLRNRAEQQNMQKRFAQEKTDAIRYANAGLVRDLLGALDDFERTLEHGAAQDVDAVLKGVQLAHDNFVKTLNLHHIEVIDPAGQMFDPRLHEALMQQPSDEHPPGTVLQVAQRGYRLHDRLLRAAKVIIAAGDAEETRNEPAASRDSTRES